MEVEVGTGELGIIRRYADEGVALCRSVFEDDGCNFFVVPAGDDGKLTAVFEDGSYSPYWIPPEGGAGAEARRRFASFPSRIRVAWRLGRSLRDVA